MQGFFGNLLLDPMTQASHSESSLLLGLSGSYLAGGTVRGQVLGARFKCRCWFCLFLDPEVHPNCPGLLGHWVERSLFSATANAGLSPSCPPACCPGSPFFTHICLLSHIFLSCSWKLQMLCCIVTRKKTHIPEQNKARSSWSRHPFANDHSWPTKILIHPPS